jgi:hypothetical protein
VPESITVACAGVCTARLRGLPRRSRRFQRPPSQQAACGERHLTEQVGLTSRRGAFGGCAHQRGVHGRDDRADRAPRARHAAAFPARALGPVALALCATTVRLRAACAPAMPALRPRAGPPHVCADRAARCSAHVVLHMRAGEAPNRRAQVSHSRWCRCARVARHRPGRPLPGAHFLREHVRAARRRSHIDHRRAGF